MYPVVRIQSAVCIAACSHRFGRNKLYVYDVDFFIIIGSAFFGHEADTALFVAFDFKLCRIAGFVVAVYELVPVDNNAALDIGHFAGEFGTIESALDNLARNVVGCVGIFVAARSVDKVQVVAVLHDAAAVTVYRIVEVLRFEVDFVNLGRGSATSKTEYAYERNGYNCYDFFHQCCYSKN